MNKDGNSRDDAFLRSLTFPEQALCVPPVAAGPSTGAGRGRLRQLKFDSRPPGKRSILGLALKRSSTGRVRNMNGSGDDPVTNIIEWPGKRRPMPDGGRLVLPETQVAARGVKLTQGW